MDVTGIRPDDDSALLAACRAGDERAWRELYTRYIPLARWVAQNPRFRLAPEAARDVAQEVMIDLTRAIAENRLRGSANGYVRTVAHNKCVDIVRRHEPVAEPLPDQDGDGEACVLPPPLADDAAEQEIVAVVRSAVETIGSPCRELLTGRFLHGQAYKELPGPTGVAGPQVGVYLQRCLGRLRDMVRRARPSAWEEMRELLARH